MAEAKGDSPPPVPDRPINVVRKQAGLAPLGEETIHDLRVRSAQGDLQPEPDPPRLENPADKVGGIEGRAAGLKFMLEKGRKEGVRMALDPVNSLEYGDWLLPRIKELPSGIKRNPDAYRSWEEEQQSIFRQGITEGTIPKPPK